MYGLDQLEREIDAISGVREIGAANEAEVIKILDIGAEGKPVIQELPLSRLVALADGTAGVLTAQSDRNVVPVGVILHCDDGSAVEVAGVQVTAFMIGGDNQFRGAGFVPAERYRYDSRIKQSMMRPLTNGQLIQITVLNESGAAVDISGSIQVIAAR